MGESFSIRMYNTTNWHVKEVNLTINNYGRYQEQGRKKKDEELSSKTKVGIVFHQPTKREKFSRKGKNQLFQLAA